jgi:Conserved region in glutamate synthase
VECEHLATARAQAARELDTVAVVPVEECPGLRAEDLPSVVPLFGEAAGEADIESSRELLEAVRMAQVTDSPTVAALANLAATRYPDLILSVRLPLTTRTAGRIIELAQTGVKVFHLCADQHGRERLDDERPGRHIKDALRAVHDRLVQEGIRDEVTLIISGGIALAEHMAKAIICGADLVAVDTPLLISLGCRVCRDKSRCCIPRACPCEIASVEPDYAAQRMVNLMGAWHSQLIEVLGAMGIREARRLRGEVGRAIFMEDIEKEAFGDLARVSPEQVRS